MGRIWLSKKATVFGIAVLFATISTGDQILIAGQWSCLRSSIKQDTFILKAEEVFEFSSEGWYVSDVKLQSMASNGESFRTSLHIDGLWSVEEGFLVLEMAQVLVSSWHPSDNPGHDNEVAALLKKAYETGHKIRNEIRWSDGNRMELLGKSGAIDYVCKHSAGQSLKVDSVADAA